MPLSFAAIRKCISVIRNVCVRVSLYFYYVVVLVKSLSRAVEGLRQVRLSFYLFVKRVEVIVWDEVLWVLLCY